MLKQLVSACLLCLAAFGAAAQSNTAYVKLVVPFPPGDALETATRLLADLAGTELGRQIVIENKVGAGGFIAADAVAHSTDGNTLLLGTTAMMGITPFLRKAPYAPSDFEPIARVANISGVFAISNNIPATTWNEFVALAKKNPGKYTYATPGEGTLLHLSMEVVARAAGFRLLAVPYKGMGPALQDFVGGQIDVYSEPAVIAQVRAGKAKALAVIADSRLPDLPDVPALSEMNIQFGTAAWIGIFAPRNMPSPMLAEVASALQRAAARPEFKAKLPPGVVTSFAPGPVLKDQIQKEQITYRKLISDLNLKVE